MATPNSHRFYLGSLATLAVAACLTYAAPAAAQCRDTCATADNGVCEDGAGGAQSSHCERGTDCTDCGARYPDGYFPDTQRNPPPPQTQVVPAPPRRPAPAPQVLVCDNACRWSYDGECDDGGPGAQHAVCAYGSDCYDCGARPLPGAAPRPVTYEFCEDTCVSAYDGVCDDGGPGSVYAICPVGTDCYDCGVRQVR